MEHRPDWINCEKEMPPLNDFYDNKKSRTVLVVFENHWVQMADYNLDVKDEYYYWILDDDGASDPLNLNQISYWMPLPMPPRGWHESVREKE